MADLARVNQLYVFPAHAGMSPYPRMTSSYTLGFPRSRGDEPCFLRAKHLDLEFSPLTRG